MAKKIHKKLLNSKDASRPMSIKKDENYNLDGEGLKTSPSLNTIKKDLNTFIEVLAESEDENKDKETEENNDFEREQQEEEEQKKIQTKIKKKI